MPEDLSDKLQDFELMLEGFAADMEEDQAKTKLLSYWYTLRSELDKAVGSVKVKIFKNIF